MGCPSVREMRRGNFILLIYNILQFYIKISIKIICIFKIRILYLHQHTRNKFPKMYGEIQNTLGDSLPNIKMYGEIFEKVRIICLKRVH